jgi:hypothetical protein
MNCKPGDIAYIVVECSSAPNLGRIVEVLEYRGEHGTGRYPCWLVEASAPLNSFNPETKKPSRSALGIIPDAWLRPISGVQIDDETPIETNIPEALQLALGIQARVWA